MLNHGTIITDLIGSRAEAADRIYLGRAVDRVEIREIEPEISQLDQVRLIVRSADGRERSHLPSEQRLRARDGVRAIMRQGDVMALDFPGYAPREDDVAVFLEAYGYYDPVRASPRDILAMRAAMPSR